MGDQDQDSAPLPEGLPEDLGDSTAAPSSDDGGSDAPNDASSVSTTETASSDTAEQQEHTGPTGENQAEGTAAKQAFPTEQRPQSHAEWYAWKVERSNKLLDDIERLVLSYVDREIPRPYYENWVHDANEMFRLMSRLKKRADLMQEGAQTSAETASESGSGEQSAAPGEAETGAETKMDNGETDAAAEDAAAILDQDLDGSAA